MNDASLIAMDCVAILGIASWFVLIGHNQYGKLSKARLAKTFQISFSLDGSNISLSR